MDTMTQDEIQQALSELEGWEQDGDAIARTYRFDGFTEAIAFIDRLAPQAEAADHHPEIRNVYATVEIRLTTHDAGGITQKDVDLARRIDAVA